MNTFFNFVLTILLVRCTLQALAQLRQLGLMPEGNPVTWPAVSNMSRLLISSCHKLGKVIIRGIHLAQGLINIEARGSELINAVQ